MRYAKMIGFAVLLYALLLTLVASCKPETGTPTHQDPSPRIVCHTWGENNVCTVGQG